jgi:16S rRNA (cytosine967-C5)-methyltransferase
VLRRHPEGRWRRRPEEVAELAALQARLLDAVVPALRPGGTLVYAVCTVTEEEGPAQVAALLERTPLRAEPPLWLWPHRDGCDGFFAARLRRDL